MFVSFSVKAQTKIAWSDRQDRSKSAIWHCAEPHKCFFFLFVCLFVFLTRVWPLLHVCLGFDISKEPQPAMTDESWRNRAPEVRPFFFLRVQKAAPAAPKGFLKFNEITVQWNLPIHQHVYENHVLCLTSLNIRNQQQLGRFSLSFRLLIVSSNLLKQLWWIEIPALLLTATCQNFLPPHLPWCQMAFNQIPQVASK